MSGQEQTDDRSADSNRIDALMCIVTSINQTVSMLNQTVMIQSCEFQKAKLAIQVQANYIEQLNEYLILLQQQTKQMPIDRFESSFGGRN